MKICIAGKNNIAVDVCEYILNTEKKEDILVIPNRSDKGINGFQKSFLLYAKQHNIQICNLESIYQISDLIFISLEFDTIINPDKFKSKELFNIHYFLI